MNNSSLDIIREQLSEKITVYLNEDTYNSLKKDCVDFETKNISEFINLLVDNYVSSYFDLVYSGVPKIIKILEDSSTKTENIDQVAKTIAFSKATSSDQKGSKDNTLNFRLKKGVVNKAIEALYNGPDSLDISAFFRSMFLSYLAMPIYRREQMIYKHEIDKIKKIIKNKEKMSYYRKDTGKNHIFNPYSVEPSKQEMFNYLVGQFDSGDKHKSSIRISKIKDIVSIHEEASFTDNFNECYLAMKENGIQFAIDEVRIRQITLTDKQYKTFWRKYLDRPTIKNEEVKDNKHICFFDCSDFQLEAYFTPFGDDNPLY